MKLTDMVKSYTQNMNLKAKLKQAIKLDDGIILEKDTVSDFLIKKQNGNYHFEAMNTACEVMPKEITILEPKENSVKKIKKSI